MTKHPTRLAASLIGAAVLTLSACGGGGGGTSTPTESVTLSGVAATGAAFVNAVVTVIDSTGRVVGTSQPVGSNGIYTVTLSANAVAPFVLVASRTDANGETQSLVSVIESADQTSANVTPITNLIAARLSASGDPTRLASELAAGTTQITAAAVADTVAEVKSILAPLLDATGTSNADPLKDSFAVDGTGYDRLLDSISISIVPDSSSTSNIEIAVKQQLADDTQPTSLTFSSTDTEVTPLPAIDPDTLVASGTSVKISDFLSRLTACYALPTAERVSGDSTVTAAACQAVFVDGDPTLYRHNGNTVSSNGAFSSLFSTSAVGVVYSQGSYEFSRSNGDLVIGYKSRDTAGAESFGTFVVRQSVADGQLRLIGNQYQYPGGVSAYHQLRRFISLGQEDYSYYSTGYTLSVTNLQSGGNPVFDRVEVTTPNGNVLTLLPGSGSGNLTLPDGNGAASGTNFVRQRSEPLDTNLVSTHPSTYDTASLFFVPTDRSEAELASSSSQGVWTFKYFLAGNASNEPDATQTYKTRARALTIGELRTKGLASLTSTMLSEISAGTVPAGNPAAGQLRFEANEMATLQTASGGDGWSVLSGQLPPTGITLFGRGPTGTRFDDSLSVRSTARTATVPCTSLSLTDDHCYANGDGSYGPGFAAGSRLNGLHLFARESSGREYAHFYAMYQLNLVN
jgi:hypothetical protein